MRKTFLILLLLAGALWSCSSDSPDAPRVRGSISLSPSLSVALDEISSRATSQDVTTFTVILDGPEGEVSIPYPTGGVIGDLAPGEYTVTLTSHPDGIPAPDFDVQVYSGSAETTVDPGENSEITITCYQANAGIFFDYTLLADTPLEGVVPTIAQGDVDLVYEGENSLATGYFAPGTVTISMAKDEVPIAITGQLSRDLEVKAKDLLKIILRVSEGTDGSITISATVNDETNNREEPVELGEPDDVEPIVFNTVFEAQYFGDKYDTGSGYFNLTLMNIVSAGDALFESISIEGFMELAADRENIGLTEGTYSYELSDEFTGTPRTFLSYHEISSSAYGTYYVARLSTTDPMVQRPVFGGEFTVTKEAGVYTLEAEFIDIHGEKLACKYTGPIVFQDMDAAEKYTAALTEVSSATYIGTPYGGATVGSTILTLSGMAMDETGVTIKQLSVQLYATLGERLEPHVYTPNVNQADLYSFQRGYWSPFGSGPVQTYYMEQSQTKDPDIILIDSASGSIEIAESGGVYTVTANIAGTNVMTQKAATVKCTYTGPITVTDYE